MPENPTASAGADSLFAPELRNSVSKPVFEISLDQTKSRNSPLSSFVLMTKYHVLSLTTKYWKPKTDYLIEIVKSLANRVKNGDFVVISEKAVSTAKSNIVDERLICPSFDARLIAEIWMRIIWGHFLGALCRFGQRLLRRLRTYPVDEGSCHKQLALQQAGLLQALMFGSEGGIDGSNLPFSYVCLPLKNAAMVAKEIQERIWADLEKKVIVMIADTDKTYSFRNFHFTPRPNPMRGIHSVGGVGAYIVGRLLKFRRRSTPLAVAGCELQAEEALKIAHIADRARGPGAGATVWDQAARFKVAVTEVNWDMLTKVTHKPIAIVRIATGKLY